MDNPWASSAWDAPARSPWLPDSAWSADTTTDWLQPDASSDPSTVVQSQDMTSEQDITAQDQRSISQLPSPAVSELSAATGTSVSDHQVTRSTSPPRDSFYPVPETSDATPHDIAPVARASDEENLQAPFNLPDDDWGVAWATTPPSETIPKETQPPDQWEAARQKKEKLNRAVPPELLDALLRHCQQASQEIWPAPETSNEDNRSSGFGDLADIAALLTQLLPADSTLPPTVQFSATATAKAMNEALKLTRHLPASASSPLSRLLASKGTLEWEKSIRATQDIVPDTAHVGWRVLEKEDRLSTVEESKPRKATGGLLSFWNRRASAIQPIPVETPSEQSRSPARSSLECVKSAPLPPSSQAASPNASTPPPPPDSHPTVVTTMPAPSAVSRFLNRFSRTKGTQHNSLALSSDDLEFLSDIVPSASDPHDEDINDGALDALTDASNSSSLPPKLPPPIPPPPKQPILSTRPSSALGLGTLDGVSAIGSAPTAFQKQGANHTPNIPVLIPPLSPKPAAPFARTRSPPLPLKDVATPAIAFGQSSTPSIQQRLQPNSQPNSQLHSSFTVPSPRKAPPSLSIPPLLPPPPVSPPQTPRPSAFPTMITPGHSSTTRSTDASSFHDSYDTDDEFSAFASFPSSAPAPFPSSNPYPAQRSPSPPSPPPRRTYERTHYPSSSSTSSILSPASQTSVDQLCSTMPSVSASLDSFDDFVSPPSVVQGDNRKRSPPPPPLPIKPQSQHRQPSRIDTLPSRVYHAHTPSQTSASPTVHTSLMNSIFSLPSVSRAEHQRTQSLVNHAATRGGVLWPNSHLPDLDEQKVRAIPPPPSSSTSPGSLIGEEAFDLLGDGNTLGGGLEVLPSPLSVVGGIGMNSSTATSVLRAPFGVASGPGKGLGSRNPLQPSPPPLPSTSTPTLSFSSLGTSLPVTATNTGSVPLAKPKQTGGLSAQDLSFFEGL